MSEAAKMRPIVTPIGLSRTQAATYIGLSETKFDQLVEQGSMPRPKRVGARLVWDRRKVTEAFEALPDDRGAAQPVENPWDEIGN